MDREIAIKLVNAALEEAAEQADMVEADAISWIKRFPGRVDYREHGRASAANMIACHIRALKKEPSVLDAFVDGKIGPGRLA